MGGYVAARATQRRPVHRLFLIAPAFYLPHYPDKNIAPNAEKALIVHGWSDEIVPVENSIRYAREYQTELHILPGDHALEGALPAIQILFESFLRG